MRKFVRNVKKLLVQYRRTLFETVGSDRYSFSALDGLDRALGKYLDFRDGTFIECGANDGITYSNTYWLERFRGWRGVLIEALPEKARSCAKNRPAARVFNTALVAADGISTIKIVAANMMSYVPGSFSSQDNEASHRFHAAVHEPVLTEIEVPARTLASIFEELKLGRVDVFSLDVEGYEVEVLRGMNVQKNRPRHILVETKKLDAVLAVLDQMYSLVAKLSHHDYLLALKPEYAVGS